MDEFLKNFSEWIGPVFDRYAELYPMELSESYTLTDLREAVTLTARAAKGELSDSDAGSHIHFLPRIYDSNEYIRKYNYFRVDLNIVSEQDFTRPHTPAQAIDLPTGQVVHILDYEYLDKPKKRTIICLMTLPEELDG